MTTIVGRSHRTLWKHTLLYDVLGREVGVFKSIMKKKPHLKLTYVMIDLCAGDGRLADESGRCSPEIMIQYRDWLREQGYNAIVILVEKQPAHYTALKAAYPTADYVILGDSRQPGVIPSGLWDSHDYMFIHNDPNSIADFALAPDLVAGAPMHTTTLSTMGCNVKGLKRLPFSEREGWYSHVHTVLSTTMFWHDALIIRVDRDDAQWAYLLTQPKKWRPRTEMLVTKAFAGVDTTTAWWRLDRTGFREICDYLFMTHKERGE